MIAKITKVQKITSEKTGHTTNEITFKTTEGEYKMHLMDIACRSGFKSSLRWECNIEEIDKKLKLIYFISKKNLNKLNYATGFSDVKIYDNILFPPKEYVSVGCNDLSYLKGAFLDLEVKERERRNTYEFSPVGGIKKMRMIQNLKKSIAYDEEVVRYHKLSLKVHTESLLKAKERLKNLEKSHSIKENA